MRNEDIRQYAKSNGVKLWEIAEALGLYDGNFSRKLRRELSDSEKARVMTIVDTLCAEKDGKDGD